MQRPTRSGGRHSWKNGRIQSKSNEAFFLIHDLAKQEASFAIDIRVDPTYQRQYAEYYGGMNQWIVHGEHLLNTGTMIVGQIMCDDDVLLKSEFYNDYLVPMNMRHTHGVTLIREGSMASYLTTMRSKTRAPFGEEEMAVLKVLVPHLQHGCTNSPAHRRSRNASQRRYGYP